MIFWKVHRVKVRRRVIRGHYKKHKRQAEEVIRLRLQEFNRHYGFSYNRVTIRNQKTRWGSCSLKRNLSFNYKILFLPSALQDYLIVHELCHLAEMNHSKNFWSLVGQTIPNPKQVRAQLKRYVLQLR